MNARVTCSSCGQVYELPTEALSKTYTCTRCGGIFRAIQGPPPLPPPLPVAPLPVLPIDAPLPYSVPVRGSWQPWIWGGVAFVVAILMAMGLTMARLKRVQVATPSPAMAPRYVPPPRAPQQPTFSIPTTPPPRMPSTRASPASRIYVGSVIATMPSRGTSRSRFKNGVRYLQWTPYVGNTTQQADYAFWIVSEPQVESPDGPPSLKQGDTFCSVSDWGVGPEATVDTATIKGIPYTRVHEGDVDRCYSAYINGEKVSIFHTAAATDNAAAGQGVRAIVESLQKRKSPATRPIPVERP